MSDTSETPSSQTSVGDRDELRELLARLSRMKFNIDSSSHVGRKLSVLAPRSFLVPLLKQRNPMVRFAAVEALRLGDFQFTEKLIDELCSLIDDRYDFIAASAILALGDKGVCESSGEIESCLGMKNGRVAAAALRALDSMNSGQIEEVLLDFLHSDEPLRVKGALRVFVRRIERGDIEDKVQLCGLLKECIQRLRPLSSIGKGRESNQFLFSIKVAIQAIGLLKDESAIDLLRDLAVNHIGVRTHALEVLHAMNHETRELAEEAYQEFESQRLAKFMGLGEHALDADYLESMKKNLTRLSKITTNSNEFQVDSVLYGKAIRVKSKEAFIELENGLIAILPIDEYDWGFVRDMHSHRGELNSNQKYLVTTSDSRTGCIRVSRRQLIQDPWETSIGELKVGEIRQGEIEMVADFGLFVKLMPGLVGLVHRTALSDSIGHDFAKHFKVGDTIGVKILEVIPENRRIRLSQISGANAVESWKSEEL